MKTLVVDTNCFIHNFSQLKNLINSYNIITTEDVYDEIKDPKTIENVKLYLPHLMLLNPSESSIKKISLFAKKTGDINALSKQDIGLIALALDKLTEQGTNKFLNLKPKSLKNQVGGQDNKQKNSNVLQGWCNSDNLNENDGWIGPQNVKSFNQTTKSEEEIDHQTLMITTDFAMQNVIMQIKIPLLNLDGKVIKVLKNYVLECYSCWKICKNLEKVFCPSCGKDTLLKVTCEYKENGELVLYRKKNFEVYKRGSRYPIPQPKGGRKINELILNEDDYQKPKVQSYLKRIGAKMKKEENKVVDLFDHKVNFEDMSKLSKKYKILKVGYGKKNPNVNSFWKNKNNQLKLQFYYAQKSKK